ncbi:MAG: hypothetical protein IJ493_13175 [Clostridia bacterium]|nr:hypothetical protein [Clostridia bacterium]
MLPTILTKHSYITYLYDRLRATSLWSATERIAAYSRRFLFITRLLKWIAAAVAVIETSAMLLTAAALLLILLPALLAVAGGLALAAYIDGNRKLHSLTLGDRVIVFFAEGGIRLGLDGCVFVVTDSLRHRFLTMQQRDGVYYIRRSFFIRLRKRYFDKMPQRMIYIF